MYSIPFFWTSLLQHIMRASVRRNLFRNFCLMGQSVVESVYLFANLRKQRWASKPFHSSVNRSGIPIWFFGHISHLLVIGINLHCISVDLCAFSLRNALIISESAVYSFTHMVWSSRSYICGHIEAFMVWLYNCSRNCIKGLRYTIGSQSIIGNSTHFISDVHWGSENYEHFGKSFCCNFL